MHLSIALRLTGSSKPGAGGGVSPPVAPTLTAPADAQTFEPAEEVTVSATSTDGDLDRIDWIIIGPAPATDETVVATDSSDPYSQTWTVAEDDGDYTMVARAVRGGLETDSDPIDLTIETPAVVDEPDVIFGANLDQWVRADSADITVVTGVSAWLDKTANNHDFAQATEANQPVFTEVDATVGNRGSVTGNGTSHILDNNTLNLGTPGAEGGIYYWYVLKQVGWTATDVVGGGPTAARMQLTQTGTEPELRFNNGGGVSLTSTDAAIDEWVLVEMYANNATTDFLRVGAAAADETGINVGNGDPVIGVSLFGRNATAFSNVAIAERGIVTGLDLTAIGLLRQGLRDYVTDYYGGAVSVP